MSDHRCYFTKATLCCTNSLNISAQQYAIAALGSNPQVIEICRPHDSQWLVFGADKDQESDFYEHEEAILRGEHREWLFNDLLFYKGMLYGLTRELRLVTFELWDSSKPLAYRVLNMLPLHIPHIPYEDADEIASYLVESCGELLMVFRLRLYTDNGYEDEFRTIQLLVFKLDQSNDLLQWVQVQSLGDQMLFLGTNYCLSVSATGTPGFKGNCIYFTDDGWPYFWAGNNSQASCLDNGIFYLDDGRIETFYDPDDSCQIKSQPIWVTPNNIFSID
ncbi:hypothetical protein AQUCO_00200313v1 [Aquilegia coerulea]|uniref:KIB1-4 beta-propeller domain-containing protein n=1 Tax=Aquilegia coerulea TaxID=218851 RepID=A0A2G5F2M6_AQUCA|nr:hypothetical protein AQUCO_00200313v1 [Aquilegia coerulea]